MSEDTLWTILPHTDAKHRILKKYMDAWIPIMGASFRKILYIDAFSGPGKYQDGEDGSPIIVVKAAENHAQKWKGKLMCLFIENREDRASYLENILKEMKIKREITWEVVNKDCNDVINSILNELDAKGYKIAPTFAFLDPFGYSDISYGLVKRLLDNQRCEVLVTFMLDGIIRNIDKPECEVGLTNYFGNDKWKDACKMQRRDKEKYLHNLYSEQLKRMDSRGVFVRSFEMRDTREMVSYYLFYATKHPLGLERMKEAMWNVDTRGTFQFSDNTDPKQRVLFTLDQTSILTSISESRLLN